MASLRAAGRIASLLGLAALAACHGHEPHAPAVATTNADVLSGTFALEGGASARGTLVTTWLSPAEADQFRRGSVEGRTFRELVARFEVRGDVSVGPGARVPYRIAAPQGSVALAVLDVDHTFWETLFGGGRGFVGLSEGAGGAIVARGPKPVVKRAEPCSGERMVLFQVEAPTLAGTIGNPTSRRFCAYVPRSYAAEPARRYPVVFLFGGFMSTEMARLGPKSRIKAAFDAIADQAGKEAILVGVDASTKLGSSYLEDSPITGQFASFVSGPMLREADAHLRTLARGDARGVVGQSTGGFLAMSLGLRFPELFGVVGATAPDGLDFRAWLLGDDGRVRPWLRAWTRLEAALGGPGQMTSYAADWSPGPSGPTFPFDLVTGAPSPGIDAWLRHSPTELVTRDASLAARVREHLGGKIFVAIASDDEFRLTPPARSFSETLSKLGIAHTLEETSVGHLAGTEARTLRALTYVVEHLPKPE